MNAVFFESHLLAIAIEQIHIICFCMLGVQTKFFLQMKSIAQAIYPVQEDSHEIIARRQPYIVVGDCSRGRKNIESM